MLVVFGSNVGMHQAPGIIMSLAQPSNTVPESSPIPWINVMTPLPKSSPDNADLQSCLQYRNSIPKTQRPPTPSTNMLRTQNSNNNSNPHNPNCIPPQTARSRLNQGPMPSAMRRRLPVDTRVIRRLPEPIRPPVRVNAHDVAVAAVIPWSRPCVWRWRGRDAWCWRRRECRELAKIE